MAVSDAALDNVYDELGNLALELESLQLSMEVEKLDIEKLTKNVRAAVRRLKNIQDTLEA